MDYVEKRVEFGDLKIDSKQYPETVEAHFSVKMCYKDSHTKEYVVCMSYFKDTKTIDFWDKNLEMSEINVPFSKIEEFRNWLIANGFEG